MGFPHEFSTGVTPVILHTVFAAYLWLVTFMVYSSNLKSDIVACCLKAEISQAEQTSITNQSFDNTQICDN
jgi:hypothetical protein